MQYTIISTTLGYNDLIGAVTEAMTKGWKPLGGVECVPPTATTGMVFLQAMTRQQE